MLSRKGNRMRYYSLLHSMKNHAKMKTRELTKQQTRLSLSSKQSRIHDRSIPSSSPTSLHASFALNFFSIKEKINYHIVHWEKLHSISFLPSWLPLRSPQSFTELSCRVRDLSEHRREEQHEPFRYRSEKTPVDNINAALMFPIYCSGRNEHSVVDKGSIPWVTALVTQRFFKLYCVTGQHFRY